jgi:hypothetical protein
VKNAVGSAEDRRVAKEQYMFTWNLGGFAEGDNPIRRRAARLNLASGSKSLHLSFIRRCSQ